MRNQAFKKLETIKLTYIQMKTLKRLLFIGVLLFALHIVLFWEGSGTIFDIIKGNLAPSIKLTDRSVSHSGGSAQENLEISASINLAKPVNHVSPEYLSFTLDTSQLVGGKWWNPKADKVESGSGTFHAPVFNFNRQKLDTLVSALTPAYLRIGGSEADKVFYDMNSESEYVHPENVPGEYHQTMTRSQWDNLNAFVKRNRLKFVFTLNSGPSARDNNNAWNPQNTESLLRYSKEKGYQIDVLELGNEHNLFWYIYGLNSIVKPEQYHQDILTLKQTAEQYYPQARIGSQGSAIWPVLGELLGAFFGFYKDMIKLSGDDVDIIAWHYYPQQSRRGPFASRKAHPARLLEPENLDEAKYWATVFTELRDKHAPGRPIWLGETGNAQFGGEPGVSDTYIGGLWWLDQLGLLAENGVDTVFRQTLAGMNYGMMDPVTLELNPDYWNSVLWKKLMGTEVYEVNTRDGSSAKVRIYAHNSRSKAGVTVLMINLDHQKQARISFKDLNFKDMSLFEITTTDVLGKKLFLNGEKLELINDESIPTIIGKRSEIHGTPIFHLHPLSYSFVQFE